MASLTQWTWVWANRRRWWRTGKSSVLQPMGSQRVRPDWVAEQQQQQHSPRDQFPQDGPHQALQVPKVTLTSDQLPADLRVPRTTLRLGSFLEGLIELREALTLQWQFYYSEEIQTDPAERRDALGKAWEDPTWSFFVLRDALPSRQYPITVWGYACSAANPRSFPELQNAEFSLSSHSIGMTNWIMSHVAELPLQPPSPPEGQVHILWAQRLNCLITWLIFWPGQPPTLSYLVSINYQVWCHKPTLNNKDIPGTR